MADCCLAGLLLPFLRRSTVAAKIWNDCFADSAGRAGNRASLSLGCGGVMKWLEARELHIYVMLILYIYVDSICRDRERERD